MNIKRLLSVFVISIAMITISCQSGGPIAPKDVEQHLVVLNTNDHHGHPVAFYDYPAENQGGLPARVTFVEQVKADNPNVLVVDAGDLNTGMPESNFFNAEPDIIGYNKVGYDLLAMGNHEFDNDFATMQEQIALSEFPWLCANVKTSDGNYIENVQPYVIKEYETFKVAIIGLMYAGTKDSGNPEFVGDYKFEDEVKVANELVPMLKEKADIVMAVVHMGLYPTEEKGSKRLAANVPGLALIVDGHTHTKTEEAVYIKNVETGKDVAIVQARHWGLYMGKTDLTFMNGEVTNVDFDLVPMNVRKRIKHDDGTRTYPAVGEEIEENQELVDTLQVYVDQVETVLGEVIGTATAPFLNDDSRKMETPLGNIVSDSQKWFIEKQGMDVDFAYQNGGGIRATLGDGEIQKKTIYEVLPFPNSITLVSLKGADVIALFDLAATKVNGGGMPQVSDGVTFTINTADGTVEDLLINGESVDPERIYKIAVNSYLASGGDGFSMFNNKVDFYDTSLMQRDAFIDYVISLGGTISPETYGRITIK